MLLLSTLSPEANHFPGEPSQPGSTSAYLLVFSPGHPAPGDLLLIGRLFLAVRPAQTVLFSRAIQRHTCSPLRNCFELFHPPFLPKNAKKQTYFGENNKTIQYRPAWHEHKKL
jgi:hypothetical protein